MILTRRCLEGRWKSKPVHKKSIYEILSPSFYTVFKNVPLTLLKSATKNSFAQKTDFSGTWQIGKAGFWLKLFWGAIFTKFKFTFLNQYERQTFWYPISHIWRGENEKFEVLDFHWPLKFLCHTSKLWNIVKITSPYCTVFLHSLDSLQKTRFN